MQGFTTSVLLTLAISLCDSFENPKFRISKAPKCGIRNENGVDPLLFTNMGNEANFGEFPWIVQIRMAYSNGKIYQLCAGALITPNIVITNAYCVSTDNIPNLSNLTIRAGEWNTDSTKEMLPYQERDIARVIIHPDFNSAKAFNGIALLVLNSPMGIDEHIGTICLPPQNLVNQETNKCFDSGWGVVDIDGNLKKYAILKRTKLSTISKEECEKRIRTTMVGPKFELHESFICARGGTNYKPAFGDGGGPLVCPDPNNPTRYHLIGLVSWTVDNGNDGIPIVYTKVAKFRHWIDDELTKIGVDEKSYYTK